jgi:hypothetical protein
MNSLLTSIGNAVISAASTAGASVLSLFETEGNSVDESSENEPTYGLCVKWSENESFLEILLGRPRMVLGRIRSDASRTEVDTAIRQGIADGNDVVKRHGLRWKKQTTEDEIPNYVNDVMKELERKKSASSST